MSVTTIDHSLNKVRFHSLIRSLLQISPAQRKSIKVAPRQLSAVGT
jgi:hypothetical protein